MRKWMAVLLIALLLTGCGSGSQTLPPEGSVESQYEEYEVLPTIVPESKDYDGVSLHVYCPDGPESSQAEVFAQAAAVFEDRTGAKVILDFQTRDSGDIVVLEGKELPKMAGKLQDLTDLASAADYASHSHSGLRQQVIDRCGSLRAIVWEPELWAVYYNTDVFAACGITEMPAIWEDYMALCNVMASSGYQPLALDEQKAVLATTLHLERIFGWDGMKKLGKNNVDLKNALQQLVTFLEQGYFSGGWPEDTASLQARLALRSTAMMIGSDRDCVAAEDAMFMDLNWGVFAYPGSGSGSGCAADARVLAVSQKCENLQAAFDFIMLAATGEFDQLRADLTGRLPADPDNAFPIVGGEEVLARAGTELKLLPGAMPLAIWQSQYSSGEKAAEKWTRPQ